MRERLLRSSCAATSGNSWARAQRTPSARGCCVPSRIGRRLEADLGSASVCAATLQEPHTSWHAASAHSWRAATAMACPPASAKNSRLTRALLLPERRHSVAPLRGTRLARAPCERLLRWRAVSLRPKAGGRRGPCSHPTGDSSGGANAAARGAHAPCMRLCGAMRRWAAALVAPAPLAAALWRLSDSGSSSIVRLGRRRCEAMR